MALAEPFSRAAAALADAGDDELLERAVAGDRSAFEALYARHVDAAFRTACATAGNRHDAADATAEAFTKLFQRIGDGRVGSDVPFRAYLLATVRNTALDQHRAQRRRTPTGDEAVFDLDRLSLEADSSDPVVRGEEAAMITAAFGELPERWRSVLWLTEVEGLAPGVAAKQLGTTPNNTAQLAHRARTRLRERYLTAHVDHTELPPACRFTTERLAAFAGGGLGGRDTAKVSEHLEDCGSCRERLAMVEDLESSLRRVMLPLPLALTGAAGASKVLSAAGVGGVSGAGAGAGSGAGAGASVAGGTFTVPRWAQSAVAAGAAATLAAGTLVLVTGVVDDDAPGSREVAFERPSASEQPADPEDEADADGSDEAARTDGGTTRFGRSSPFRSPVIGPAQPPEERAGDDGGGGDGGGGEEQPPGSGGQDGGGGGPDQPSAGLVEANLGGTFGGQSGGATLGIGGGRTGVRLGSQVVGDEPETPGSDGLLVDVGGEVLPATRVELP